MSFDPDWLHRLLGPRLRWKVRRWQEQLSRFRRRTDNPLRALRSRHKMCPRCRLLVEREVRICPACGYRFGLLESTPWGRALSAAIPREFAVTPLLVGVNLVIYAVGLGASGAAAFAAGRGLFGVLGATESVQLRMGEVALGYLQHHGEYWRVVTANFLHAGIIHLFFNLSVLSYLGPILEQMIGRRKFVCVYFVSGVGGLGISLLSLDPFTPTLGASAAIFGLIASILVCAIFRRDPASVALRDHMVKIILMVLVFGLFVRGINNTGHIAGGVLGAALTLLGGPSWPRRGWRERAWDVGESAAVGITIAAFAMMIFHSV